MSDEQRTAWDRAYEQQGELWARAHEEWFETHDQDMILDLGCGTGKSIEGLNGKIVGIDFSASALSIAKKNHASFDFIHSKSNNLPFKNDVFDMVRASFLLGHLDNWEIVGSLDEILRILKFNGRLVTEVFSTSDGRFREGKQAGSKVCVDGRNIKQRYFELDELEDLLCKFKIEHVAMVEWKQRIGQNEEMIRSVIRTMARKG